MGGVLQALARFPLETESFLGDSSLACFFLGATSYAGMAGTSSP